MTSKKEQIICPNDSIASPIDGCSLRDVNKAEPAITSRRQNQRRLQTELVARQYFMSSPAFLILVMLGFVALTPLLLTHSVTVITLLLLLSFVFIGVWAGLSRSISLNAELMSQKAFQHHFSLLTIPSFQVITRTLPPLLRPPATTI